MLAGSVSFTVGSACLKCAPHNYILSMALFQVSLYYLYAVKHLEPVVVKCSAFDVPITLTAI